MTAPEIAKQLGWCPATVYNLANEGKMPYYRLDTRLWFDPDEVSAWLEEHKVTSSPAH